MAANSLSTSGQPWALRNAGRVICIAIVLTVLGALFSLFLLPKFAPPRLHGKELADVQNALRTIGLQVTVGVAAAFAGVLTWGRLELSRLEHANEVSGQITERYT